MKSAVNFQFDSGGDGLHAHYASEARQRVVQVGVSLTVIQEVFLAAKRKLADAAVACVQAPAVGDLVFSQS